MPRGHPDWNLPPGQVGVSQLGDLAELAARLGSVVTYERSGNVVFVDSFEDGFSAWQFTCAGSNAKYRLTTDRVRSGSYALALYPADGPDGACTVRRAVPLPVYGRLGLEVSVAHDTHVEQHLLGLIAYDGVNVLNYYITYKWADDILRYTDHENDWVTFVEDLDLSGQAGLFHTFKLVVDLAAETYVRLFVDDAEYDMSAYRPYKDDAPTVAPRLDVYISPRQVAANSPFLAVDDVILTQNEP